MSIYIRILLILGAVILLGFMIKKIRTSKLKIEYTVFSYFSADGDFSANIDIYSGRAGISITGKYGLSDYYFYFNCKIILQYITDFHAGK